MSRHLGTKLRLLGQPRVRAQSRAACLSRIARVSTILNSDYLSLAAPAGRVVGSWNARTPPHLDLLGTISFRELLPRMAYIRSERVPVARTRAQPRLSTCGRSPVGSPLK